MSAGPHLTQAQKLARRSAAAKKARANTEKMKRQREEKSVPRDDSKNEASA